MLNIFSVIIGLAALGGAMLGFLPFLGWMNWAVIPLALLGAGVGMLSRQDGGRRLNLFVLVAGIIRLAIGGGLF